MSARLLAFTLASICATHSQLAVAVETNNWQNVVVGGGGAVMGVYADPTTQGRFYMTTDVGGVYRRDSDNGPWIPLTESFKPSTYFGINSLTVDRNHAGTLYILAAKFDWDAPRIYKSTDAGASWSQMGAPSGMHEQVGTTRGERLQLDPNNSSVLYLATLDKGFWKSVNGGSTWTKNTAVPVGAPKLSGGSYHRIGQSFVAVDRTGGTVSVDGVSVSKYIYVGVTADGASSEGVWKSSDGGQTWSRMSGGLAMPMQGRVASDGTLYVTFNNTDRGVFKAARAATSLTDISPVGVATRAGQVDTCAGLSALNNGVYGTSGNEGSQSCAAGSASANVLSQVTYKLNTSVNVHGYTLSEINSYVSWSFKRQNQAYTASVHVVGEPDGVFHDLPPVSYSVGDWVYNSKVTITPASGQTFVADGVDQVRFTFTNLGAGYNIYRELDVIGVPTSGTGTGVKGTPVITKMSGGTAYAVSDSDLLQTQVVSCRAVPSLPFPAGALAVDPNNPLVVLASQNPPTTTYGSFTCRTTDGGSSWETVSMRHGQGNTATRNSSGTSWFGAIRGLEIDPFNSKSVWMGDLIGVLHTPDISSVSVPWDFIYEGHEEIVPTNFRSPPTGPASLVTSALDVGGFAHTNLATVPPIEFYNPDHASDTGLDFCETDPTVWVRTAQIYYGSDKPGGYSLDGAMTWTPFATIPPNAMGGRIAIAANNPSNFVWTLNNGSVYRTVNRGTTWTACAGVSVQTMDMYSFQSHCIASDRVAPNTFYIYKSVYANPTGRGEVYRSTDGGATFSKIATIPYTTNQADAYQFKIIAAPNVKGEVWLAVGYVGVFKAMNADTGAAVEFTRQSAISSVALMDFGKAAPGQTNPAIFLMGGANGTSGIFRSDDDGATWIQIDNPAQPINNQPTVIGGDRQVYGRVYIGTNGRGIYYNTPVNQPPDPPATPTITYSSQSTAYTVAGNDLLQTSLAGSPGYVADKLGNVDGCAGVAKLNEGAFGPAGGATTEGAMGGNAGGNVLHELTYTLNTSASAGGYNITQIATYAGWQTMARQEQAYTVSVHKVGTPAGIFVDLASPSYVIPDWSASCTKVSITPASGQTALASGVDQVRFTFANVGYGYNAYRELDVIGVPASGPEPEPTGLLADAMVHDGTPTTNYGTDTTMMVKKDGAGYVRWSYLKFDIPASGPITSAKLRLRVASLGTSGAKVAAFGCPTTSWVESGTGSITWNTKPAVSGSALATLTIPANGNGNWYEWDVTSYVEQRRAAGDTKATLVLQGTELASQLFAHFSTKESGSDAPQLVLTPSGMQGMSYPSSQPVYQLSMEDSGSLEWTSSAKAALGSFSFKSSGRLSGPSTLAKGTPASARVVLLVSETIGGALIELPFDADVIESEDGVEGTITLDPATLDQYNTLFIRGIRTED